MTEVESSWRIYSPVGGGPVDRSGKRFLGSYELGMIEVGGQSLMYYSMNGRGRFA